MTPHRLVIVLGTESGHIMVLSWGDEWKVLHTFDHKLLYLQYNTLKM